MLPSEESTPSAAVAPRRRSSLATGCFAAMGAFWLFCAALLVTNILVDDNVYAGTYAACVRGAYTGATSGLIPAGYIWCNAVYALDITLGLNNAATYSASPTKLDRTVEGAFGYGTRVSFVNTSTVHFEPVRRTEISTAALFASLYNTNPAEFASAPPAMKVGLNVSAAEAYIAVPKPGICDGFKLVDPYGSVGTCMPSFTYTSGDTSVLLDRSRMVVTYDRAVEL